MINKKLYSDLTKFACVFCLTLFVICLCGCSGSQREEKKQPSRSAAEIKQQLIDDNNAVGDATVDDFASVQYYTVNVTNNSLATEEMLVDPEMEVHCEMICDVVLDALEDQSVFIEFVGVSMDGGTAVVNFSGDFTDENDLTEDTETCVLDAIAQSLLDNVADCSGVSFLTDGESYSSQYRSFEDGYVYMEN